MRENWHRKPFPASIWLPASSDRHTAGHSSSWCLLVSSPCVPRGLTLPCPSPSYLQARPADQPPRLPLPHDHRHAHRVAHRQGRRTDVSGRVACSVGRLTKLLFVSPTLPPTSLPTHLLSGPAPRCPAPAAAASLWMPPPSSPATQGSPLTSPESLASCWRRRGSPATEGRCVPRCCVLYCAVLPAEGGRVRRRVPARWRAGSVRRRR